MCVAKFMQLTVYKDKSYITTLKWHGDTLPDKNEFPPFLTNLYCTLIICYQLINSWFKYELENYEEEPIFSTPTTGGS
ncbi:hypothetical protein DICPUDRAFT_147908 [Dictyostelium purpureum]|uniref:Uncharacterized protein n=1 Tax=Dictyostelium purpureum TaxID=5786 RepID=F0Z9Q9_DICPU|nr:uncharacterized protein DICPUDRAFT_147908 [Dictyostelium purpureum]EGC39366.1 hypothetical protein DICPUDRAFT_147908 [Dictyostelium purpureum]|eukprot:XP_003284154.1 hypothetical protein DICPUDRAFT_147908 [Dictyostelium purpureum]